MSRQEEYFSFIAHIDNITDRRPGVTATYLSVNTAIVGIITFVVTTTQLAQWGKTIISFGLLIAGMIACTFWRRLILQHNRLLDWWYTKIRVMEETLPESSMLITKEYRELYAPAEGKPVIGMAKYELRLPWFFISLYVVFAVIMVTLMLP
jgi:hypothetical protein